jgi:hypothetical protein
MLSSQVIFCRIIPSPCSKNIAMTKTGCIMLKKNLIYYIAHVYDLVNIYLKEKGHVKNIFEKMKICLQNNVDFGWFNCQQHLERC